MKGENKMNKKIKKALKKIFVIVLILSICLNTTAMEILAKEADTNEMSVKDNKAEVKEREEWDGITQEDIFENETYRVIFSLTGHWNGGYNANVKIENTSGSTIENWSLGFNFIGNISNIWNAVIDSKYDVCYNIKNVGWNRKD